MTPSFPKIADEDLPSDRQFGRVFAVIFIGLAAYCAYHSLPLRAAVLLVTGTGIAAIALVRPKLLHGSNRAWSMLGLLLGKVVGTIVLGVIFLSVITPLAVFFRLIGRDELRLKKSTAASYWRPRDATSAVSDFRDQF